MSQQLISRSADLQRLEQEGFDIDVVGQFLLVRDVPYVNASREVKRGVLVTPLALVGDVTMAPDTHVAYFSGEYPCDQDGRPIEQIRHSSETQTLHPEVTVQHSFSSKPANGYASYHAKMTTYAAILSGPASALDSSATPCTFPVVARRDEDSVFAYQDTSSSRAKIVDLNEKLGLSKVAIVGLGGTGSYVLDLVAKTPVREIHLIDGDVFSQHNAFRCPGAPSVDDLKRKPAKVQYLAEQYFRMRRGIFPHATQLDESNLQLLDGVEFAFICIDSPSAKRLIIESLVARRVRFVDVGIGILRSEGALSGIVRVTTGLPERSGHITSGKCISFADAGQDDEYSRNIQVADLNALNAALAVIKWKKLFGFYHDLDREHHSLYTISGNDLQNEERA